MHMPLSGTSAKDDGGKEVSIAAKQDDVKIAHEVMTKIIQTA